MLLKVVGSGSSGNCYVLENDNEALIIECGCKLKDVKIALGFNVSKVVGAIVSHEHGDHAAHISQYELNGIKVFKPYLDPIHKKKKIRFGNFDITSFDLVHDVECRGFYITHPELGKMIYVTDTEYVKYRFNGLNHMLVEANYSKEIINKHEEKFAHVVTGHMSIDTACEFIKANDSDALQNVIFCHLSNQNANDEEFINKGRKVAKCPIYIADKGIEIEL